MTRLAIPVGASDHAQGPGTAPVTIVEYGDCECSSCGGAYPTLKALACAAGPRLRFVLRNFPLAEMRPHALHAAALAGRCADGIRADFPGGVRSGMNGMPTLFVNGLRYDGPRDLESLAALMQGLSPSIPVA